MADLIALHWGPDEVTAVAPAKGRDVRAAALGAPPSPDDPAVLGRWLKSELGAHRFSAKRAVVVLPRSAAVFRKLTLPDVPDDELPDLVRMQAATKCPTPLDRLRLDFVPLPRRGEMREVLLATIPAKTADDVLAAVRAAGLEPAGIGLSPFGTAARVVSDDASTLVVAVQGTGVEITLVRESAVVLSHANDLQGGTLEEDRKWLLGEVTRAVVAADHLAAAAASARVVLVGPGDLLEPLVEPFAERYGGRAELIDGAAQLGITSADKNVSPAALAAAAGQLDAAGPPRLDFVHPRKRIEKPDRRRLRASLAAAGLVAVAVIGYGLSWSMQSDLENTIANLRSEDQKLKDALKRGEPTLTAHQKMNQWLGDRADWVEQLATLDSAMPGTDRVYLKDLHFDPAMRDTLGRIRGVGYAKDRYDVQRLNQALAAKGYVVEPKTDSDSPRDPQYPRQFELQLTIPRPKPQAPPAAPTAPARPQAT
jgi:Tfp pilus assembly protein PilN